MFATNGIYQLTPDGLKLADQGMAGLGGAGLEDLGLEESPEEESAETQEKPEETNTSGVSGGQVTDEEIEADKSAERRELNAFIKWASKGLRNRPFNFENTDPIVAEALNRLMADGDIETARTVVSAYTS